MSQHNQKDFEASPIKAGLRCRCPRCGKGKLFESYLRLAPKCPECGLDFSQADSADGPAVFIMLIVGFVVAFSALITEVKFTPPIWIHVILWGPAITILSLLLLPPLKGWFVAAQLYHDAQEGRIKDDD